jgi:hypothetical protein
VNDYNLNQFDQWDAMMNREDPSDTTEMGNICPNQFNEENEELACGLGRALGVDDADFLDDVMKKAQHIANTYGIPVQVAAQTAGTPPER